MTDRELLELAAKAAGHSLGDGWNECGEEYGVIINGTGRGDGEFWNPLVDDGDALRLAVKLNIHISGFYKMVTTDTDDASFCEDYGTDPYAATRRAIVRAAAEIGKAMK